jgi:hypothetical protein
MNAGREGLARIGPCRLSVAADKGCRGKRSLD